MKQPNILLKVAAVVSSLLLVGGFVTYRAGAFNGLRGLRAQPVEPAAPEQPPAVTTEAAPTIMYGSKAPFSLGTTLTDKTGSQAAGAFELAITPTDKPANPAPGTTQPSKPAP